MKKALIATLLLTSAPAAAQNLTTADKAFVALGASGVVVAAQCHAIMATGGLERFGDRTGVAVDTLYLNIREMLAANANLPYDRKKLDPAVTRFYIEVADVTAAEIKKNKTQACRDWIKVLRRHGIVE